MSNETSQLQRNQEKLEAVDAIRQAIRDLSVTSAPLGRWQRHNLAHALVNLERGLFGVTLTCADLASMTTGYSEALIRPEPAIDRMTIADFEAWLKTIEHDPAPLHPIFSPIHR